MPIPPSDSSQRNGKPATWHWALVLPLVLGAGLVMSQIRDNDDPSISRPTPQPTSQETPRPATPTAPNKQYSIPSTVLVVGDDEKLHHKPWKAPTAASEADLRDVRKRWVGAVVQGSPQLFPPGTQVRSVEVMDDVARVDFNRNFAQPQYWQGSTKTLLAIYSVVNTVAAVNAPKGSDLPVLLLVEGKPVTTLGEFDTSDPIEPDYTLVAKD